MTERNAVRVILVDDHPAVRQGLALLLGQHGHTVCAEAGSRSEALAVMSGSEADIAIIDLSLGEDSGLELLHGFKERNISGLVYSMYEDPETITLAFDSGAGGYITKREMAEVLLHGVLEVHAGRRFISPRAAQSLAMRAVKGNGAREVELSERERQILHMLGQGESAADIAREFIISTRTVETYYSRLMEKLGLVGMKELRKFAINTRR
ncbi:MAG: LuxR family transcriptional [Desulfovibrionaceae bacterium]|nr:MAG: LuxR family transcriptional [Desulfovibrionaceae bacterium]